MDFPRQGQLLHVGRGFVIQSRDFTDLIQAVAQGVFMLSHGCRGRGDAAAGLTVGSQGIRQAAVVLRIVFGKLIHDPVAEGGDLRISNQRQQQAQRTQVIEEEGREIMELVIKDVEKYEKELKG